MKFVIFFETGQYDDHRERPFLCMDHEDEAVSHAEELNDRLREFGLHREQDPTNLTYDDRDDRSEKLAASLGLARPLPVDYSGATFFAVNVPEIFDPR